MKVSKLVIDQVRFNEILGFYCSNEKMTKVVVLFSKNQQNRAEIMPSIF